VYIHTFAIEEFMRIFARKRDALGDLTQQLNNLGYVIIIFTVSRPRGRIEEIVATSD
jgi:hypothetical protein